MYKAWFVNCLGHGFSKVFNTFAEMDEFIERAFEVGTRLTSYVSL